MKQRLFLSVLMTCMVMFVAPSYAMKMDDANIMSVLQAVDQNEINAAKVALSKTTNDDVKAFATMLLKDHESNMEKIKELSKAMNLNVVENRKSKKITHKGMRKLEKLKALSGDRFDWVFIKMMVKGHKKALHAIDKRFLPHAKGPQFIQFLKDTRATVAEHLAKAQQIKKQLKK